MQLKANHLWERYLKGDQQAFEQIYFTHVNLLYDYGVRLTKDTALVEDCIQDLFSDLWEKRTKMSTVHNVKSYLLVAVRHRIVRKLSSTRNHTYPTPLDHSDHLHAIEPDLMESLGEEKHTYLIQAFAKLSDKQKEVIYLRFYNQLTYEEIAEVMSVQVKAVYKLMARAIQTLRHQMASPMFRLFLFAILAT